MTARTTIAVIGSGISGLSAAWLLSRHHDVTLYEAEGRPGGHSNTVDTPGSRGPVPVDTGFIVYNPPAYPNLVALFAHLGVPTAPTRMSFGVSLDGGAYEYAGSNLATLFAQPANLLNLAHWRMIRDTLRFFREAPGLLGQPLTRSLGDHLRAGGYSEAFVSRHLLPMAAAIWSTPSSRVMDFPVASFARFFSNHGLLQATNQPVWRTVVGGSRAYVKRILDDFRGSVRLAEPVKRVTRTKSGVAVVSASGEMTYDAALLATHANDTLSLLADADRHERDLLGAFAYVRNRAILHTDASVMPRRRRVWSSWNYAGGGEGREAALSVTYWMNSLQPLAAGAPELFVTLNPQTAIAPASIHAAFDYAHPMFDARAMAAQRRLWQLQGRRNTWFCGSYFGYGFHEDGLQSGLAAAEDIGGVRRPWSVPEQSGRITTTPRRERALEPA